MQIGCHVSIAGGIDKAPQRAADLGCEVMQIFTRSPQGGKAPEITDEIAENFRFQNSKLKIQNSYIHTPYFINFASANNRIRYGSVKVVREELERGSLIGAKYVLTHLGTARDLGPEESITKTVEMLKKCLDGYAGSAKLLLENSAGAGAIMGNDLEDLGRIIKLCDGNIAGICLDTQHSFASGYDWRDFENTLKRIDKEIGPSNIKLIHANDSQTECAGSRDRHAHIGEGLMGLEAFKKIVHFAQEHDIDMILETKHDKVEEDIELLKKMRRNC
jgi:deoxyribonuclease-4